MLDQIAANVQFNLRFYRRNRVLLAIAILFLFIAVLFTGVSMLFNTHAGRFEIVRSLFAQLNVYAMIFVAGLGLFLVTSQVRGKSVKLVFTRPCPPHRWLLSGFLSATLVAIVLYAAILLLTMGLSLAWGIPLQAGFALLAIRALLMSVIVMTYLSLLSMVMHPILAVLVVIIFNEGVFYGMRVGIMSAVKSTGGNVLLPLFEKITYAIYLALPMYEPYGERFMEVESSLRVTPEQWMHLLYSFGYTATIATLFYLLSLVALRRKSFM